MMDKKVQMAIKRLDELIQKLDDYKPLLEQNTTCAEFEIRANFNSLMEFLCERQSTLLKQLKNVAREKSLLIESNRQTLESLRAAIISSQTTKNDVDLRIPEYIKKVESIVLNDNLTPFVTFRAESNRLKQSVSTYGRLASRYPGHFEDPSQPSASLPRALEEEEDHDVHPAHSAVLGRVSNSCPCMDPNLRRWLSPSEHRCKYEKPKCDNGDNHSVLSGDTSVHNYSSQEHNFRGLTEQTAKLELCSTLSSVHIPYYPLKSTIVRKWLELRDDKPTLKRPSTTSVPSIITCTDQPQVLNPSQTEFSGAPSSSFGVLTGSSVAVNLKDWLFCDSMELSEMPGLSSTVQSRACPAFRHKDENNEKCVTETELPETVGASNLLPPHLRPESSIDLNRWLRPREDDKTNSTSTESAISKASNQTVEDKMDTTVTEDCPVQTCDYTNQYCPLYGQCQGGPGGPTCCAARFTDSDSTAMEVICCQNSVQMNTDSPSLNDQSHPKKLMDDESDPKMSMSPFDRIIATDWKQWILPSANSELVGIP